MADIPELSHGYIKGRFLAGILDLLSDAGDAPDAEPMQGYIQLSATTSALKVPNASPDPAVVFPGAGVIQINLDSEGYLVHNGQRTIALWATDDTDASPVGWQWRVSFFLTYRDREVAYASFNFDLPAGETRDMASIAPVLTPSPGQAIIRGPRGPGFSWKGAFSYGNIYNKLDTIEWNNETYVAVADGVDEPPSTDPAAWELMVGKSGLYDEAEYRQFTYEEIGLQKSQVDGIAALNSFGVPLDSQGNMIIPADIDGKMFMVLDQRLYPNITKLTDEQMATQNLIGATPEEKLAAQVLFTSLPDVAPFINAVLATAPRGTTVRLPQGAYKINTPIIPVDGVTLWAYGCEFISDSTQHVVRLAGNYDQTYQVSDIQEQRLANIAGDLSWTQLVTIPAVIAEKWQRGDLVRMFSDDWIPGGRPGSGTAIAGLTATFAAATNVITTSAAHGLKVGDGVYLDNPTADSGIYNLQRYYVKSVPSATTLTIASEFMGGTLSILVDGTATGVKRALTESRTGQFFAVVSAETSGGQTQVRLDGRFVDPMRSNVRIARMSQSKRLKLYGGSFDRSDRIVELGSTGTMLSVRDTFLAEIKDVTFKRNTGSTINASGNFGYLFDNIKTGWNWNNPSDSHFGYGIMDNQSSFGIIRNSRFYSVRHGVSDDSVRIAAGDPNPGSYGRTMYNKIVDSWAINCTSSGFDTHHHSLGQEFLNLTVIGGDSFGIGLRGRKHIVRGLTVRGDKSGVNIFTEEGGGDSWGHIVEDVTVENPLTQPLRVYINTGNNSDNPGPLWNKRETRKSYVKNLRVLGADTTQTSDRAIAQITVQNATIQLDDLYAELPKALVDEHAPIALDNGEVYGRNWEFDYTNNEIGITLDVIKLSTTTPNIIDVDGVKVRSPRAGFGTRMMQLVNSSPTDLVRMDNVQLDEKTINSVTRACAVGSYVNYWTRDARASSRFETMSTTEASSAASAWWTRLSRTTSDMYIQMVVDSDVTLPAFPAGRVPGERLVLSQIGTGVARILNGSAGNTLNWGADIALRQYEAATWVWTTASGGRWRQIAGPRTERSLVKAANKVMNNTSVLMDDSDLTFDADPNSTYIVEGAIFYDATTTSDIQVAWTVPSGATGLFTAAGVSTGATSGTSSISLTAVSPGSARPAGAIGVGSGGTLALPVRLVLKTGSTGGPVSLKYAQLNAEASDLTVRQFSYITAKKV